VLGTCWRLLINETPSRAQLKVGLSRRVARDEGVSTRGRNSALLRTREVCGVAQTGVRHWGAKGETALQLPRPPLDWRWGFCLC